VDIGQRVAGESTLVLMFHCDFGVLSEYCTCNFE
jgi:hypothetical protein